MNDTCSPTSSSTSQDNRTALYVLVVTIINAVLAIVVPYMVKLRPVQNVLYPRRTQHKKNLQHDLASCIASMQQLAKTMSERSSEGSNTPRRLDPLSSSNA